MKLSIYILCFIVCTKANSQLKNNLQSGTTNPVLIGEKVPDIVFTPLVNYSSDKATFSDFKNKMVIVDFWSTNCAPCIKSMPLLDSIQKKYKDELQIIQVTTNSAQEIKSFLNNSKKLKGLNLSLPAVTDDTLLRQMFQHVSLPHYVWISKSGIVQTVTGIVTEEAVKAAIKGEPVTLPVKEEGLVTIDKSRPFFLKQFLQPIFEHEGITDSSIQYSSKLFPATSLLGSSRSSASTGRMLCVNYSIVNFFQFAFQLEQAINTKNAEPFSGNRLIYELEHPEKAIVPKDPQQAQTWAREHTFCYDLLMPGHYKEFKKVDTTREYVRKAALTIMKSEIEEYFGVKAFLDRRKMPCLIFKCQDSTKMQITAEKFEVKIEPGFLGGSYRNLPVTDFINSMKFYLQTSPYLVDESGYKGLVTFEIKAPLYDYKAVSAELEQYGFTLEPAEREIEVIVITDKNK